MKTFKTFKYRLYPNIQAIEKLEWTLDRCCKIYNDMLRERKSDMRKEAVTETCGDVILVGKPKHVRINPENPPINKKSQSRNLTEIKKTTHPEYYTINDHILRNVLERIEFAFERFFDRCQKGEVPGYPRFRGKNRYDSFGSDSGFKLNPFLMPGYRKKALLTLQNIGDIPCKMHRPIEGKIKTYTIKREGTHWYVTFACEVESEKLPLSYEDVGIDAGIAIYAALSDGKDIDNPRYYRKAEKKLAKLQRTRARKQKPAGNKAGSNRWRKAGKKIAKLHRKTANQRKDFQHKVSREIVNKYQVIAMEDLQIANMVKKPKPKQDEETSQYLPNGAVAKAGLNKSISDAGWGQFMNMIEVKAEWAGRTFKQVNPHFTSQTCPACEYRAQENRQTQDAFVCQECGYADNADHNAAHNILKRAQKELREVHAMDSSSVASRKRAGVRLVGETPKTEETLLFFATLKQPLQDSLSQMNLWNDPSG